MTPCLPLLALVCQTLPRADISRSTTGSVVGLGSKMPVTPCPSFVVLFLFLSVLNFQFVYLGTTLLQSQLLLLGFRTHVYST